MGVNHLVLTNCNLDTSKGLANQSHLAITHATGDVALTCNGHDGTCVHWRQTAM